MKKTIDQKIDELARMTERGFGEVHNEVSSIRKEMATKADLREMATKADLRELATKVELRETEEHLLDAMRGIEVKRRDFEALTDVVESLVHRVSLLEKKR